VQLGEVKTICEILFAARINALDSIQRVRVSADDAKGPQSDYLNEMTVTNEVATLTPYTFTFRCFSPELARVICGFASCSNAFIIKNINVQPAGTMSTMPVDPTRPPGISPTAPPYAPAYPGTYPGAYPGAYLPGAPIAPPALGMPTPGVAPVTPATSKGGLQTVLKEQLLRVTLELELVKLLPKS
jgi:hypothetical protein